ncbi:hypothetical protein BLNAU_21406 [Blattamonas nauphoetae]|uniref:Uncharacterized protein n=1 Tax=Blattamonas nauphoetae TaxID=2049346 RepID=A0ABQ9WVY8_9EUKA|nr:hypothetical protein BLNAU_21406 [Blattamonas nauphoetae]
MSALDKKTLSSTDRPYPDCIPFMNWQNNHVKSIHEKAVIYRSLVATVKFQPALDASLEAKAVRFLKNVVTLDDESADAFLFSLGRTSDESLTNFIHSIVVLLSSPSHVITTVAMKMVDSLFIFSSESIQFTLVKADLIPQLINTLNPHSLSFAEAVDIHTCLISRLAEAVWCSTPFGLANLEIEDYDEQKDVRETVFQQVLAPSEKYIRHLCVNRFSIIDGDQSKHFLTLLAQILQTCPYHQPTMDFVLYMPLYLAIPSCLTFFEKEYQIWSFLDDMVDGQREWNNQSDEEQQTWETIERMLRMEGIEDMIEEKLQNDRNGFYGGWLGAKSIEWSNLLGMNLSQLE